MPPEKKCVSISLLNMKGGVGKTTLAVNLAWFIHKYKSANVLIVDLDPQFNATQYLMKYEAFDQHKRTKGTLADLLIEQPRMGLGKAKPKLKKPEETLVQIDSTGGKRFMLLPAELNLGWVVKNPAQMDYKLEKILGSIRNQFDFIFIDCAPTESVLTTMALMSSNYVITPIRPDRYAVLGFANFLSNLSIFKRSCPDPHDVQALGVVFTQLKNDSPVEAECIADIHRIAAEEKETVFENSLHHSNTYIRAIQSQSPAFITAYARSKIWTEFNSLTAELFDKANINPGA